MADALMRIAPNITDKLHGIPGDSIEIAGVDARKYEKDSLE